MKGKICLWYLEKKADTAERSDGMNCRWVPRLAKPRTYGTPHCHGHICMGSAQPASATPHPRPNRARTRAAQTAGGKRGNTAMAWPREASRETAGTPQSLPLSQLRTPPSQLVALQGSHSQSLCSAKGNGHSSGERHLCCAGTGAGAAPALEAPAVRAEALLAARGEQGACSEQGVCTAGGDGQELKSTLPSISDTTSFPLPTPLAAAAWRCPCQDLFPCHHLDSLPKLPEPIPPTACSALPCRDLPGTGHCTGTSSCLQALNSSSDQP